MPQVFRKIIDSNALENASLHKFLAKGRHHQALLTEAVNAEMHQDYALKTLRRRLDIVRQFPSQVLLTKTMKEVSLISPRTKGLARRFLDYRHTAKFHHFCSDLYHGDHAEAVRDIILENEAITQRRRKRELGSADGLVAAYQEIASNFKADELAELRTRKLYGASTQRKLIEIAFIQGQHMAPAGPLEKYPAKTVGEAVNQFPFRYALAATLLFTRWMEGGSQAKIRPDKLRNDVIDLSVAVFGTYFHGVVTHDKKLADIHNELRFTLRSLGGYVPETAGGQRW